MQRLGGVGAAALNADPKGACLKPFRADDLLVAIGAGGDDVRTLQCGLRSVAGQPFTFEAGAFTAACGEIGGSTRPHIVETHALNAGQSMQQEAQVHAALESATQQRQLGGISAGTAASDDGAHGRSAQPGEVGAVHHGQRNASVHIIADLDARDIGQAMRWIFGETTHPFQSAGTELLEVGGHGVDEIIRVGASGVHTYLRVHLVGASGMLTHGLFDRTENVIRTQVELDYVRLGEKKDFDGFHESIVCHEKTSRTHRCLLN